MRKIVLHGHIFKNAGTTLDWSLARNFGESFVDHREDDDMRSGGAAYLRQYLEDRHWIRALSSHHLCCPLPTSEHFELIPIFLLRHPVERIWSVYHFERQQQADTPGARAAKKLDLKDYVLWRMDEGVSPTIRNYQTRYCSELRARGEKRETRAHLEQAKSYLADRALVGLVARYDESMVLLEQQLRERGVEVHLEHVPQNVTSTAPDTSRSDKIAAVREAMGDAYTRVEEKNALDLELYEFATSLFQRRLAGSPGDRERLLEDFAIRCRAVAGQA